jgi:hypothetical protein
VTKKIYHLGTFGTMVRFFPLFDFKNNDAELVTISELDIHRPLGFDWHIEIPKMALNMLEMFNIDDLQKLKLFFYTKRFDNRDIISDDKYVMYYALSNSVIGFGKCDSTILIKYLRWIDKNKVPVSTYKIVEDDKDKYCDQYICYGIDEFFLNDLLIPVLLDRKEPFGYYVIYNILLPLNEMRTNKAQKDVYVRYINEITGTQNDRELMIMYKRKSELKSAITSVENTLLKKTYELYYRLLKEKDYSCISEEFLKLVFSKNTFGYAYYKKYKFFNSAIDDYIEDAYFIKHFPYKKYSNVIKDNIIS